MPAHYEWLTLYLCALLLLASFVSFASFRFAKWHMLKNRKEGDSIKHTKTSRRWGWLLLFIAFCAIPVSWLRTEGGFSGTLIFISDWLMDETPETRAQIDQRRRTAVAHLPAFPSFLRIMAKAEVYKGQITTMPDDWRTYGHAQNWFRSDWCVREGIKSGVPCDEVTGGAQLSILC